MAAEPVQEPEQIKAAADVVEAQVLPETAGQEMTPSEPVEQKKSVEMKPSAERQGRVRRTKGGPQIYGQNSMPEYDGAQGVIRRDVRGGHSADAAQSNTAAAGVQGRSATRQRDMQSGRTEQSAYPQQDSSGRRQQVSQNREGNGRQASQNRPAGQGAMPNGAGAPAARAQQAGVQQPYAQAQRGTVPPYAQTPQSDRTPAKNAGISRKIKEAALNALSSSLLIFTALFFTVYFASSVAAIFLRELNYGQTAKLLTLIDFPTQLDGYVSMFQAAMSQLDNGLLAVNLIIRVPDLLFCLGLWVVCITARTSKEKMSGAGFLFLRLDILLNMIVVCVILLVVLVLSVTLVIATWSTGTHGLIAVAAVTLVLAIVVTMAIIMYYFCYLATIKIVRRNAQTGEPCGKASAYVAVILMITSLTGIISILSGIVNLEITGITTGAGRIGWMILFGIWILRYRATLSEWN